MTNKDGGAVFPVADLSKTQCPGLSIRDWFAGLAMQAVIIADGKHTCDADYAAKCALIYADALLAERSNGGCDD